MYFGKENRCDWTVHCAAIAKMLFIDSASYYEDSSILITDDRFVTIYINRIPPRFDESLQYGEFS